MERLKLPEGEAIEAGIVSRSIESAQRKVEARNFDIRKQLLEYDDVSNEQRKIIYLQRNEILEQNDVGETIANLRTGVFTDLFAVYVPPESVEEQWDILGLQRVLESEWHVDVPLTELLEKDSSIDADDLLKRILAAAEASYQAKVDVIGREGFAGFERSLLLQSIDTHWREHLAALDYLRQGIHLRGYAQKNPKQEYKREAFELFAGLLNTVRDDVIKVLMTVSVQSQEQIQEAEQRIEAQATHLENLQFKHTEASEAYDDEGNPLAQVPAEQAQQQIRRVFDKVGRNEPCPCGSGNKFKHCHGKLA
jgi:preprotein translocase subunit SecA